MLWVPFSIYGHPYFVDFVQSLFFSYNPPKKPALSTTLLNKKISLVLEKVNEEFNHEKNLISAVDGRSDFLGRSLYAFSKKFIAVVSDAEAAMQMEGRLTTEKVPNILSICCMAHHLNFVTTDLNIISLQLKQDGPRHGIAVLETQPEIFRSATIIQTPQILILKDNECIGVFNRNWAQFDTNIYLAFFLYPKYRDNYQYIPYHKELCA
ncbi:ribonuclease H-like domain-containing protein [Rhizophagus clarus]|uniref:Ribonuclease H-like domain-containing protein n=1 Tax=Rhizophagus clarus TaxID=94130 RepID=A0A8H3QCU6_9GLOM|nr:ribonuclease H-like domain-containing protein [Rhizophagus clarus]